MKSSLPLYATTDRSAPFVSGAGISEQNPLQVSNDMGTPFDPSQPVSPSNPLPVTGDMDENYYVGQPISQTNRLPVRTTAGAASRVLLTKVSNLALVISLTSLLITSANPSKAYDDGAVITGTVTASRPAVWSVTGDDAPFVTINSITGVWSCGPINYNTKQSYNFFFRATGTEDGTIASQVVFLVVNQPEEVVVVPEYLIQVFPVPENASSSFIAAEVAFGEFDAVPNFTVTVFSTPESASSSFISAEAEF